MSERESPDAWKFHSHGLEDPVAFCKLCQSIIPTPSEKALWRPTPEERRAVAERREKK